MASTTHSSTTAPDDGVGPSGFNAAGSARRLWQPPRVIELAGREANDACAHALLWAYHVTAKGHDGLCNLTVIDPPAIDVDAGTERKGRLRPQQFAVGAVDEMAAEAVARGEIANVYFAPAVLRKDLPRQKRDTLADIVVVLGLVVDDDGDGKSASSMRNIEPTFEVVTSRKPTLNRQLHFVFTRALTPPETTDIAGLLHRKRGGDHGTKDIAHIWRVPGTKNFPNLAKTLRGRPSEPQTVELVGGSFKRIDPDELRRALEAMPDVHPGRSANGRSNGKSPEGGSNARAEILARLPGWLIDLIDTVVEYGQRSDHCCRVMQALMEHGLTDEEVHLVAHSAPFASKYTERGDLDEEIARERAYWTKNGAKRANLEGFKESQFKSEGATAKEPEDLDLPQWPSLQKAAFHGLAGRIAKLATKDSEADPVAVLGTAVAMSAAVFGRKRFFNVGDTAHHARLFVGLVGQSSRARKGTSTDPVSRIFEAAEGILHSESTLPFPCGLSLKVSQGPLSSGEGLIHAVRDGDGGEDKGVEDKRLLIIESEFGNALQQFRRQGNNLSQVLRSAWDGKALEPLIKTNKTRASEPHVCLLAHITRQELLALLTGTDVWNGLANRVLWLVVRRRAVVPFPKPIPQQDVAALAQELAGAIKHARGREGAAAELTMAKETKALWGDAYRELTRDRRGALGAVTSRVEAQVLRLAMTYAMLDRKDCIELAHLEAALALGRYSIESSRRIFGETEPDPMAQRIVEALASGPKTQSQLIDLFQRNQPVARIGAVLADLQERGVIALAINKDTGGRPSRVWSLVGDAKNEKRGQHAGSP